MKQAALVAAVVAIIAAVAVYQQGGEAHLVEEPLYVSVNAECTKTLEVECAIHIERTVKACATAFETGGSDVIADIKCVRDLLSDKKECWPCLCAEAKKKGWHVVGC